MDVITTLRDQHAGIRRAFVRAALWQAGPGSSGYLPSLGRLAWHVLRHAAREERAELPVLSRLGRLARWRLAAEISLARELAPTRPHPQLNGELANKLAMPALGPADRVMDLAARWRGAPSR